MMKMKAANLLAKFDSAFAQENWDELSTLLDPKVFKTFESKELVAPSILAKVAQILTTKDPIVPNNVKIACLKCLGNTCIDGYVHKEYIPINMEEGTCCQKLYSFLARNENLKETEASNCYRFDYYFPYQGVIEWAIHFITSCKVDSSLLNEDVEILRLSIQFLCNLFSFAYKDNNFPDQHSTPQYLCNSNLSNTIIHAMHSEHITLVRAACIFIHNTLKEFEGETFTHAEKIHLCTQLLKPIQNGFESAKNALILLLCHNNVLQYAYNDMSMENKLYLLQIIYNELPDLLNNWKTGYVFAKDAIEFLIERFCRRSDLILKTADTQVNGEEATEIVILLYILGILTSKPGIEYRCLKSYKSLLINCTYLLKSIQMLGKQSDNYFTPLQNLKDLAPAMQKVTLNDSNPKNIETKQDKIENLGAIQDLSSHPAFGFKAGLIRVIGNMSYRNKELQDLLREMDAVPLLLDCCNIDARNPLIMQWTILALRNLCEDNPANQEIIRDCNRVGVVESSTLREMGITLHEDEGGKKIGIVPLPREKK